MSVKQQPTLAQQLWTLGNYATTAIVAYSRAPFSVLLATLKKRDGLHLVITVQRNAPPLLPQDLGNPDRPRPEVLAKFEVKL